VTPSKENIKMKKKIKKGFNVFDALIDCRVSVLFDNQKPHKNTNESYMGTVLGRSEGFLMLKPWYRNEKDERTDIEMILLREDKIISFWIYSRETIEEKP
jgi:hypothetical protein